MGELDISFLSILAILHFELFQLEPTVYAAGKCLLLMLGLFRAKSYKQEQGLQMVHHFSKTISIMLDLYRKSTKAAQLHVFGKKI